MFWCVQCGCQQGGDMSYAVMLGLLAVRLLAIGVGCAIRCRLWPADPRGQRVERVVHCEAARGTKRARQRGQTPRRWATTPSSILQASQVTGGAWWRSGAVGRDRRLAFGRVGWWARCLNRASRALRITTATPRFGVCASPPTAPQCGQHLPKYRNGYDADGAAVMWRDADPWCHTRIPSGTRAGGYRSRCIGLATRSVGCRAHRATGTCSCAPPCLTDADRGAWPSPHRQSRTLSA